MNTEERVESIDWVRGLVMVLMALDHTRFFFSDLPFPPEDMAHTWMALFLTRWVTHLCAPAFFLLSGTSAYLSGRHRGASSLSGHLWRRGLWLVILELTVIGFAWSFIPGNSFAGVIWCLGWSMVLLALLVRLGPAVCAVVGLVMIACHNLFDNVQSSSALWHFLHVPGPVDVPGIGTYFVLFPIIPWAGVMALGYGIGPWFELPVRQRARRLAIVGTLAVAAFVVLRLTNIYGNPATSFQHGGPGYFRPYASASLTAIAFLNTEKYPPSLQYLLMTLGPCLLLLATVDRFPAILRVTSKIVTFGRVPFFFYVLHLYAIHIAAIAVAAATGRKGWLLPAVWLEWLVIVVLLYFPCRAFESYKNRRRTWWLSYV